MVDLKMCGRYFQSNKFLIVTFIVLILIINSIFILSHLFAAEKASLVTLKFNFNHTKYDTPGKYFDLSEWHIQVPERPINHPAIELMNGYSSKYFYYDQNDESMVFMCPNVGVKIRTVLANNNKFRITNNGFYYQNATIMLCNNTKYIIQNRSDTFYSMVISTIHGASGVLPLLIVQWYSHTNEIIAYYKTNNATRENAKLSKQIKVKMGTMQMGIKFTVCIIVNNGILSMYFNSKHYFSVHASVYWSFRNYFSIGNSVHHPPNNVSMKRFPNWHSKIKVFKLENIHSYPEKRGKLIFDPIQRKLKLYSYHSLSSEKKVIKKINNKLLFSHIPKNAGTSIEDSAKQFGNVLWGRFMFEIFNGTIPFDRDIFCCLFHICHFRSSFGSPWHIPLRYWYKYYSIQDMSDSKISNVYDSYFERGNIDYFCVIRNPYTKIISEYNYEYQRMTSNCHLGPLFLLNQIGYNITKDMQCTEYMLNLWIQTALLKYNESLYSDPKSYCECGCHFVKQYDYVYDSEGNILCKHLVHFENLMQELSDFLDIYGFSNITKNLRTIKRKKGLCDFSIHNLTIRTRQIIYEMYKKDFDTFQYDN